MEARDFGRVRLHREEETPQRSAEYGTFLTDAFGVRHLRKEILYDKNTFRLPRQHLTKWSKTQYLCGIAATGAGLLSTFYQH